MSTERQNVIKEIKSDNIVNSFNIINSLSLHELESILSYIFYGTTCNFSDSLKNLGRKIVLKIMNILLNDERSFKIKDNGKFFKVLDILNIARKNSLGTLRSFIINMFEDLLLSNNLTNYKKILLLENECRNMKTDILHLLLNSIEDINLPGRNFINDNDDDLDKDIDFSKLDGFEPFYYYFTDCITDHSLGNDTDKEYYFQRLEFLIKHCKGIKLHHIYNRTSFLEFVSGDCYICDEEEDYPECQKRFAKLLDKYNIEYPKSLTEFLEDL